MAPRPNVIIARIAPKSVWSRLAWWSVPRTPLSPVTSTIPARPSASWSRNTKPKCANQSAAPNPIFLRGRSRGEPQSFSRSRCAVSIYVERCGFGAGVGGPIQLGQGRMAEQMVQVGYNAQHKVPWHWPVAAYMVTKISAGLFYS